MHDAITFERAGIPAAVVVEDLFEAAAGAKRRMMGMPELEPVIVPHPLGVAAEAERKGRVAAPSVIAWLTEGTLGDV